MERLIPSWRIIVDQELARLNRLKQSLRAEDQTTFEDLMNECKHLCVSRWGSRFICKGIPTLFAILFVNHRKSLNSIDE
jgi:hypothetical protein